MSSIDSIVSLANICSFCQRYPIDLPDKTLYAFAGGTAIQCWLRDFNLDRVHHDIDVFVLEDSLLQSIFGGDVIVNSFALQGFEADRLVPFSPATHIQVEMCRGSYFDSEITPNAGDVRLININGISLPVLSPEFVAVSKLSYPSIHRSIDFQDILALCTTGHLQDAAYLSMLLTQTSLHQIVTADDILSLETDSQLQELAATIQRQLIRRFLY